MLRVRDAFGSQRLRSCLRSGLPVALVAALALIAVATLLVLANSRTNAKPVAYVEFSVTPTGCEIEVSRSYNATGCTVRGRGVYELSFATSLRHTSPVVSRGSCCPGPVGASVLRKRTVLVAFPRLRRVARATIVLP
jgi:hypothetical protein